MGDVGVGLVLGLPLDVPLVPLVFGEADGDVGVGLGFAAMHVEEAAAFLIGDGAVAFDPHAELGVGGDLVGLEDAGPVGGDGGASEVGAEQGHQGGGVIGDTGGSGASGVEVGRGQGFADGGLCLGSQRGRCRGQVQ